MGAEPEGSGMDPWPFTNMGPPPRSGSHIDILIYSINTLKVIFSIIYYTGF
jgi:hypothetical protein